MLDPGLELNQCLYIHKCVDQTDLATMPGVALGVNLRNPLRADDTACKAKAFTLALNIGQMSPEVQNRGISGARKRTDILFIF